MHISRLLCIISSPIGKSNEKQKFYQIFRLFCITFVNWRIWMSDRLFITIASKYVYWLLSLRECKKWPDSVGEFCNKWRKEIQIIVYMWSKILYEGINKSDFSLHQLVIKRKEKQIKRNVKYHDFKTNVIYFRTINYCDI